MDNNKEPFEIIISRIATERAKPAQQPGLINVYFELSSSPPREWSNSFEAKQKIPMALPNSRRAWIEGQYIVCACDIDEVERDLINPLKAMVSSSNDNYNEFLEDKRKQDAVKDEEKKKQQEKIDKLKDIKID